MPHGYGQCIDELAISSFPSRTTPPTRPLRTPKVLSHNSRPRNRYLPCRCHLSSTCGEAKIPGVDGVPPASTWGCESRSTGRPECFMSVYAGTERQSVRIPKVGGSAMTHGGNNDRVQLTIFNDIDTHVHPTPSEPPAKCPCFSRDQCLPIPNPKSKYRPHVVLRRRFLLFPPSWPGIWEVQI